MKSKEKECRTRRIEAKLHEIDSIKCYYTNADGVMNKRKEIYVFIELYKLLQALKYRYCGIWVQQRCPR